jgi:flagella basal body P-ring formation protein FlgA
MVRFAGAISCAINRSDTKPDPDAALAKWIDAREQAGNVAAKVDHAAALPTAGSVKAAPSAAGLAAPTKLEVDRGASTGVRSLRELLTEDLSIRLNVPVEQLQVAFNPKDERLLNLCEPQFRFNLDPQSVRNLGEVSWNVSIVANGGTQKTPIVATARAWQTQVVVNRPIPTQAPIRGEDVVERRTLADRLPDEPLLTMPQCVGQQAARELRPGMVLIGRMVEAVPLARVGQLVTVNLSQGAVRVKSVARAMEGGSYGQRIRVKNEATNDFYDVVLTGPQEATLGETGK